MDWQILLFALIATLCTSLVSQVWFSRLLFGDIWMRELAHGRQRVHHDSTTMVIVLTATILMEFMTALIFRACLYYAGLTTAGAIFGFGALIFIGFILPVLATELLWSGKSPRVFAIHAGHRLVTLMILCILGSIWI